jgi:hypothetical protein
MKTKEKIKAIKLRKKGFSLNEIRKVVGVSKGTVSLWVKNVLLTNAQKQNLLKKGFEAEIVERRRQTRLFKENLRRQIIVESAKKEVKKISKKELWLIGIMLYWAEGGKTQRGLVRFSNSDPEMIKIMMKFFRHICKVPEKKFRCYIHIHPHLNFRKAEQYWSQITKVPLKQFFKTYRKLNKFSQNKRDTLPFGTLDIYVCDTLLFLKIFGWAHGIFKATTPR